MEDKKVEPLLSIEHLSIGFENNGDFTSAVEDISFSVSEGEILGIVGESGSGKSVTALSILRLLSKEGRISKGSISFQGNDILGIKEEEMQKLRGSSISMVFQEPMTSLNPVQTIRVQLEEVLLLHENLDTEERKRRIIEMLKEVGLQEEEALLKKYPHELSGGMRQRVMLAMAMLCKPKLLIADEPTTALDVTIQAKILKLLKKINQQYGTTILLISHNLGVIRSICNRGIVMHQGKIEEAGTIEELFLRPQKEYTKSLLQAVSKEVVRKEKRKAKSKAENNLEINAINKVEINEVNKKVNKVEEESDSILTVTDLQVFYEQKKEKLFSKKEWKEVVKGVTFTMRRGEILGVVGESGCGKSSLVKAVAHLQHHVKGKIELNTARPQMVFQDPYSSLNPAKKIGWLLEEPLRLQKKLSKSERKSKVNKMLEKVGLSAEYADRYPSDLSGGQRQRIAIAMAVIMNHEFIILDEPVSALDVTIQAQILELLMQLQQEFQLSYLFISHDMSVIQKICDRVLVMYEGNIVEMGKTKEIFDHPQHEYTIKLLSAVL